MLDMYTTVRATHSWFGQKPLYIALPSKKTKKRLFKGLEIYVQYITHIFEVNTNVTKYTLKLAGTAQNTLYCT